ncbi:MAG: hypothetical protein ACLPWF_10780 [Bryobacteraceae bacterium]
MNNDRAWLESELQRGLRGVNAPPQLWDRVQRAQLAFAGPRRKARHALVWAVAAAALLIGVGLAKVSAGIGGLRLERDSHTSALHCENPAQLRAWVRAKTGLNLPLRPDSSPSIQLIGAQTVDGSRGVEVDYRAGNCGAVLLVSRADAGASNIAHNRVSGNVSSWVMDGQRYTLACSDPASLQLACKLCHLD